MLKHIIESNNMVRILIPMAGEGTRFSQYGFQTSKYLLPMNREKETMLEYAIKTLRAPKGTEFIFVIRDNAELVSTLLKEICQKHEYTYHIVQITQLTEGPACSCYLAKKFLNDDVPLIISNSDQVMDWNYDSFMNTCSQYDGCVLTYDPGYAPAIGSLDKHSFVKMDSSDRYAEQFSEKKVISSNILVGIHYYSKSSMFLQAYESMIENNDRAPNGEFYISLTYNPLISFGYKIGYHKLPDNEHFYPVGEPIDYFHYLKTVEQWSFVRNNLSDMTRGWFIGDFIPSVLQTKDFEVGFLSHKKDETWPVHIHEHSTEINVLISGSMKINEDLIKPKEIFIFYPGMIAAPKFLENCEILCVKFPSLPRDKIII